MSEWQPMDTAPRDGTRVLGFGESAGEINGPSGEMEIEVMAYDSPRTDYAGYEWRIAGDAYANWFKPTHWQPLPAPPK
jgi:hypothetical protein